MLLATRCPSCETVFRLQSGQLALRRGLVRCGHCEHVFDAATSLYELADGADFSSATPVSARAASALTAAHAAPPDFSAAAWDPWAPPPEADIDGRLRHNATNVPLEPVAPGIALGPVDVREARERDAAETVKPPARQTIAERYGEPAAPAEAAIEHAASADANANANANVNPTAQTAPAPFADAQQLREARAAAAALRSGPEDHEPHFGAGAPSAAAASAQAPAADEPFAVVREARAAPPRRVGWRIAGALVSLLLAIGLLGQLAWWQRENIVVAWPPAQALYAQACGTLGCTVLPPHDIDGLLVEPSDLRQIDGPHKLELKMPLRNRFNIALAYPAIELTLLDAQNNIAVRRVLWPRDYVSPGTAIGAGLPPHATQTMIVRLDTGNATASNFRVQIFYP
jgi:predicted Zn finger-like uncharacterized protein